MCILLIVGIIIGAIAIKTLNVEERDGIVNFFNSFFKLLNKDDVNSNQLLKESVTSNIKTIIIIWLTGVFVIGIAIIPIIVILRGFAIGFTVGFLVNEYGVRGFLFSVFALLPQNVFIIPGIISISSIGINYALKKVKQKSNGLKTNFINYSSCIFLSCILILLGCLVEAFISPLFMKFIVGNLN